MPPPPGPRFNQNQYVVGSTNGNNDYCDYSASGPVSDCSQTQWNEKNGILESTVCLQCGKDNQCRFSSERGTRNVVCTKTKTLFNNELNKYVSDCWQAPFKNVWGFSITDSSSDCGEWREVHIVLDDYRSRAKTSELIWRAHRWELTHGTMGSFLDWAIEHGFEVIFEKECQNSTNWKRLHLLIVDPR